MPEMTVNSDKEQSALSMNGRPLPDSTRQSPMLHAPNTGLGDTAKGAECNTPKTRRKSWVTHSDPYRAHH